jgi:hypothetical protein
MHYHPDSSPKGHNIRQQMLINKQRKELCECTAQLAAVSADLEYLEQQHTHLKFQLHQATSQVKNPLQHQGGGSNTFQYTHKGKRATVI